MSDRPPRDSADSDYEHWPINADTEYTYVGVMGGRGGLPVLFSRHDNQIHEAEVDGENRQLVPKEDASWDVDPEESLGDALERIGDETGWDSLSEFAHDHLQDEE